MRIQHNIMAMNAYRNYNNNTSALSKNLERLSSGYKINRAGDDAAGLAISEKMRAQITGLTAAQKNVKDGISLVNTAEGAMQEIQDMLNRMVSLATQSANGTYDDDVDRMNLQKEVDSLKAEINRIADSANFNGIKLLDGSLSNRTYNVTTTTGGKTVATGADLIMQTPAEATEGVGTGTITKKTPLSQAETSFELDLQNLSVQGAKEGDELKVTIGNQSVTLKAKANATGAWDTDTNSVFEVDTSVLGDTDQIADAIMKAFNSMTKTVLGDNQQGLYIDGEKFNATISENGDNKVTFTQVGTEKTVNPNLDVKIEYSPVGGGASASVANVNVGSPTSRASFSVDLTLPATGTTDMCMFGQYFRVTDGAASQSLDGGIASHALGATSGSGSESDPWVITRNDTTTDKEIMDFIAGKLNSANVSVGGKSFTVTASADGMSLNFRATEDGAVTSEEGALDSAGLAEAVNAQVTVSSGSSTSTPSTPGTTPSDPTNPSDPDTPGTTTTNPLGTVSATAGTAAAATAATATVDLSTAINGINDGNAGGGTVTVDSTTYSWGTSAGSGTTITGSTTADLQAALRTELKNAAETANSGWTASWGTGDDANKLTLTANTPGSSASAPAAIFGETPTTVPGTDGGSATPGSALADLGMDNLEGGTLTVAGKTFFFSKYNDASAAAGGDETVPSGATAIYLSDYGSAATLASKLNTELTGANAPTGFTAVVTEASGKVNIALTESSGNEGSNNEAALQGAISFTPKATTSGGGTEAEGIEIVRMSLTAHEDTTTTTPSSISGTANASIGVGGTAAVKAVYESEITETSALQAGNTITIGGTQYEVVASGTQITDGENKVDVDNVTGANKLAEFIASKVTDNDYDITANGNKLVYTAKTAGTVGGGGTGPSNAPTAPTISVANGSGSNTPNISAAVISTAATNGADAVAGSKTLNASTLDSDAIKAAADAVSGIANGAITIEKNASNNLELKINDKVIGTSTETVDGTATTFTFKTSDGTALGTATASAAPATSDFTGALDTGLTYTAATTGTPGGDDTNPPSSGGDTDTTTVNSAKLAVSTVDFFDDTTALDAAAVKAVKKAFEDIGSNGKILVNQDVEVDLSDIADSITAGTTKGKEVAQTIADKAKAAAEAWNAKNSSTLGYKYTNIRVSTNPAGTANDIAGQTAGDGIYILMDQQSVPTAENSSKLIGTYNVNTTQNLQGAGKDNDVLASTIITEEKMKTVVADGNVLTIGNKSYVFRTAGADSKVQGEDENGMVSVNGKQAKVIDVSDAETADQARRAMEILGSKGFADNDEFTIGYEQGTDDGNRLSIHETKDALDVNEAADQDMIEKLKTIEGFNSLITVEDFKETNTETKEYNADGKALSLQIGDTSDDFNQLKVNIGDMHTSAMFGLKRDEDGNLLRDEDGNTIDNPDSTIDSIRIDSQEAAKNAINTIKDAINYVSSVRGDLGAISNRLDHTANNLSVMAENITDAESTIRDTDIAEEMMAYTKNNILVQSAQAMLAQANQVPQGVLQLLQ